MTEEKKQLKVDMDVLKDKLKEQDLTIQNAADPKKLKEQRDLLIDLRQKIAMYEKELTLVSDNSQLKIDKLEKENNVLKNRDMENKESKV